LLDTFKHHTHICIHEFLLFHSFIHSFIYVCIVCIIICIIFILFVLSDTQGPFWFVVLHESAYDMLRADNITAIIKDYVTLAPVDALLSTPMWEKHHIRNINECTDQSTPNANTDCQSGTYFKEDSLPTTDPTYINRDPVYMAKAHPSQYKTAANIVQTRLLDSLVALDKRQWMDTNRLNHALVRTSIHFVSLMDIASMLQCFFPVFICVGCLCM
jgi:hypothetical protein